MPTHRNHLHLIGRTRRVADNATRSTRSTMRLLAAFSSVLAACTAPKSADPLLTPATSDSTMRAPLSELQTPAFGARIYVSAVNCEMNAADARRINTLPRELGITVEVIFTGIATTDTAATRQARTDLGLTVPTRVIHPNELATLQHTGTTRLPIALVIKAKQLSTIISAESMPKTLELVTASFSPTRN